MKFRHLVLVLLCWVSVAVTMSGQSGSGQEALEAARKAAVVDGDLPGAIKQYQAIVKKYEKTDRAVAAQALLKMAECYEKQRNAEAQRVYQRVIKEYADQPAAVAEAQRRELAADARAGLGDRADGRGANANQAVATFRTAAPDFFTPALTETVRVSPDGHWVAYGSRTQGLVLRRVAGGPNQVVAGVPSWSLPAGNLIWSPDSSHVAFQSMDSASSSSAVRVVSVPALEVLTLFEEQGGSADPGLQWSADSQLVAFVRGRSRDSEGPCELRPATAATCVSEVNVLSAAGGRPRIVAGTSDTISSFIWSPAGRTVAYTWVKASTKTFGLTVMSLDTSSTRLVELPQASFLLAWTGDDTLWFRQGRGSDYYRMSPAIGTITRVLDADDFWLGITPDASSIVVRKPATGRLAVYNTRDQHARPLTTGAGLEMQAMLSPDGRLVFFASNRDGRWASYVVPIDAAPAANPQLVARLDGEPSDSHATVAGQWGKNGLLVAHTPFRESHIARAGLDPVTRRVTGELTRLTVDFSETYMPTMSPDGSQVAFSAVRNGRSVIAVMQSDGTRERVVLDNEFSKLRWRGTGELLYTEGAQNGRLGRSLHTVNVATGATSRPPFAELPVDSTRERLLDWDYLPTADEILYVTGAPPSNSTGLGPSASAAPYIFQAYSLRDGSHRVIATREQFDFPNGTVNAAPDGRRIAYTARGILQLMDVDDPARDRPIPPGFGFVMEMSWSADGNHLLACNLAGRCSIASVATGEIVPLRPANPSDVGASWFDAQWTPDGKSMLVVRRGLRRAWIALEGITYDAISKLMKSGR